jgi:hypothetical protein
VKPVLIIAIGMALLHDGTHVVVQHLLRHTLEIGEGILVAAFEGFEPLVGDELNVGLPAPAQRAHERR